MLSRGQEMVELALKRVRDKSGESNNASFQVNVGDSGHSSLNMQGARPTSGAGLHTHHTMHEPTSAAEESVANDQALPDQYMESTSDTSTIVYWLPTSAEMPDSNVNSTDDMDTMAVDIIDVNDLTEGATLHELVITEVDSINKSVPDEAAPEQKTAAMEADNHTGDEQHESNTTQAANHNDQPDAHHRKK